MVDFDGPDKAVGARIMNGVSLQLLYWESVKSLDVQRMMNAVVLNIESETQEYLGMGRESWKDADVKATLFLYQTNPLSTVDEATLETALGLIHTNTTQYNPVAGGYGCGQAGCMGGNNG